MAAPLLIFAYMDKSPYSQIYGFSLVAQMVKKLPVMWETWVPSLGWEDPLEKGKATHSSILPWPGEFHGLCSPWGRKELDMTERLSLLRVVMRIN